MSKSKYQPYAQYKPSQSEWLDKVPEKWEEKRLKFLISQKITDGPHETPKFISEGVPFLSVDGIQNDRLVFENCRFISQENHTQYKLKCFPRKGDILLGKAASVGKVAIVDVDFEFNVWSPLALIRANKKILSKYIYYSFKANTLQDQVSIRSTSNTQHNLSMDDIPELWLTFPSVENQKVIIAFLDCETAKIDQIIDKNNRLVKLLQEQRQAIITRAVTKGLDPHAHLKFSGIDWLGDIPEDWEVKRLKYVSYPRVSNVDKKSEDDIKVMLCNYIDVYKNDFIDENIDFMEATAKINQIDNFELKHDDILITKDSETPDDIGISAYVKLKDTVKIVCGYHLAIITPNKPSLIGRYLFRLFHSKLYRSQFEISCNGVTRFGLNSYIIFNINVILPPLPEQKNIADYIDDKTAKIDEMTKKVELQNQKLQEYRQALISNAVTGKIRV